MSVVSVNIRNIAVGGAGVGEVVAQSGDREDLLGISAFVPFSAPGERVSAQVVQEKKRHLEAELCEVELRSPARVEPRCQYFGACGGCELQHMSYQAQLEAKHKMIDGALRAAKVQQEVLQALQPMISGEPYRYRHRLTLHVDQSGRVGLYRVKSRAVVPIEACEIAVPALDSALKKIQKFGAGIQGKVSSILLEADSNGVIAILKSPYALSSLEEQHLLSLAKEHFSNVKLLVADMEVAGIGRQLLELPLNEHGSLVLHVPAGSFSQVNMTVNQQLIGQVLQYAEISGRINVLDLYAGAGNFSLPLARKGAKVTAVECDPRLVSLGRDNAQRYGLEQNLNYIQSSVEKYLAGRGGGNQGFDLLVCDPPRNGLGHLAGELPAGKRLLLISCHLPSFVRDLKNLIDLGYRAQVIQPFDMFAQTSYVELLTVFVK